MDAYHGSLPHKYRKKNGEMGERRVEDEAWEEGKQVPKYRGIKAGKKSTREEITSADKEIIAGHLDEKKPARINFKEKNFSNGKVRNSSQRISML